MSSQEITEPLPVYILLSPFIMVVCRSFKLTGFPSFYVALTGRGIQLPHLNETTPWLIDYTPKVVASSRYSPARETVCTSTTVLGVHSSPRETVGRLEP